jgi:DNA polymerase-3 subunit gamma/tau
MVGKIMAYQALYRRFRSQTFKDVIGQGAVATTLRHAVMEHQTSHAYLFTGPRGTGKTSVARILAKAVNCMNPNDGEPCNVCENCVAITNQRFDDVIEIDAASNNGVDEIRNIRDTVMYPPKIGNVKVYIIDEVHMLSTGAFNALLKTLEEPPSHVMFILATTEPYKVLPTIVSRTQRFDFKRISVGDIVGHLKEITKEIDVDVEERAYYVIARAAQGGMRDALSIMDMAISFAEGTVTLSDAMAVTGSLTYEMMDSYLEKISENDTNAALNEMDQILAEGKESKRFLEDLIVYLRDLLMYQQSKEMYLEKNGEATKTFDALAGKISSDTIFKMIEMMSETEQELRFSMNAQVYLEVITVKLSGLFAGTAQATAQTTAQVPVSNSNELMQEIAALKKELEELKKNGIAAAKTKHTTTKKKTKQTYKVPVERIYKVLRAAIDDKETAAKNLQTFKNVWPDLLDKLPPSQSSLLKYTGEPVAASATQLVVSYQEEFTASIIASNQELMENVTGYLGKVTGMTPELIPVVASEWPKIRKDFVDNMHANGAGAAQIAEMRNDFAPAEEESKEDKLVDEAINFFGKDNVEVVDD